MPARKFQPLQIWIIGSILLALGLSGPISALALSADEELLLKRVRAIAGAPVDDFSILGDAGVPDSHYRYQLAFLSYGLCSLVAGEPALRTEAHRLFVRLLEKMECPTTLAYWGALGYPGERVAQDNAMYRGHLNLMYALAHDRFGETRFDERFHALSRALFENVTSEHPVCCEPDQLFVQCNSVIVLSLYLHDRAFGTKYSAAGEHLLIWAREHMSLQGTILVRDDYHPSNGTSSADRSGYANAWTIAFLSGVPSLEGEVKQMYSDWRRIFIEPSRSTSTNAPALRDFRADELLCSGLPMITVGFLAAAKGAPSGEKLSPREALAAGLLATTFGVLAARAEHDEPLHNRLSRTVTCVDTLVQGYEKSLPPRYRVQVRTFRAVALFARTFRGWKQVLEVDNPQAGPAAAAATGEPQ